MHLEYFVGSKSPYEKNLYSLKYLYIFTMLKTMSVNQW